LELQEKITFLAVREWVNTQKAMEKMAKGKKRGKIVVHRELCKGCGLCIAFCPQNVMTVSDTLNQMGYSPAKWLEKGNNGKMCVACATCATICPDAAIEVYRE
jgi:2-oxoglutarate ferredoxin oxidoreductase subunit delta